VWIAMLGEERAVRDREAMRSVRWRGVVGVLVVVAVSLGLGVSSAHGGKSFLAVFGSGEFRIPAGVAINQASGAVYVIDAAAGGTGGGQRVLQLTLMGVRACVGLGRSERCGGVRDLHGVLSVGYSGLGG
jgi:hypothetical protein